jgi:hypothetical protein
MRSLLLGLTLVAVTGCSLSQANATTGNMAGTTTVTAPAHTRWYTGQLTVEPAGHDRACLLLVTPHGSFALRPASKRLAAVAWEQGGQFDATHSGIARGGRLIAPYSQSRTSVRGGEVAAADAVCSSHRVLAFTTALRGRPVVRLTTPATPTSPTSTATQADGPSLGGVPASDLIWLSGRLIMVPGNQGHGQCLALDTSAGAYALGSATNKYDTVEVFDQGKVNPRETGIHIHGRTDLGMARILGQQATIEGSIMPGTDFKCSRYHTFAMVDLR